MQKNYNHEVLRIIYIKQRVCEQVWVFKLGIACGMSGLGGRVVCVPTSA